MTVTIDFQTHKKANNKETFENAETLYRQHKISINGSIIKSYKEQKMQMGSNFNIPTGHLPQNQGVGRLYFEVGTSNQENLTLLLQKIDAI